MRSVLSKQRSPICLALLISLHVGTASLVVADSAEPEWPRERLVALLRELSNKVFDRFVVQDTQRRVYGMTYEFVRDGQHVQDFGLDTMHDGAWFLSALVTAHRIDPQGGYLDRAQRFQVPFYVNVLRNSDHLFPHMVPREGQETFDAPIKGWAPRGWDDGPGIDLVAGVPFSTGVVSHEKGTVIERDAAGAFQHAYFTSSHHLLQDLADSLLNVWLSTRDPAVAEAILLIHENRMKYGHRIPVVQKAAGLTNGQEELFVRPREPEFDPAQSLRPLWQGLVGRETISQGHYNDVLAWTYREEAARAALAGKPISSGFVSDAIGRVYSQRLATEAYFTPDDYQHGYTLAPGVLKFREGHLESHHDPRIMMFARGIQYAWITAALLPTFRANENDWNAAMRRLAADGTLKTLQEATQELGVEFQSDPARIAEDLDTYTLGVIDYWAGVRGTLGYLPRGYFTDGRNATWVRVAELGAYAHLMKLVAFRLMQLDGVTEWDLIRQQEPDKPLLHRPLPASVLKIQGLD